MFTSREDVIWAAGLFEGEGCFATSNRSTPGFTEYRGTMHASLRSTDEDVVRKFHQIVGIGRVYGPNIPSGLGRKSNWVWQASSFEHVQAVAAMFWQWLGQRRRETVNRILRQYKALEPASWEARIARNNLIREALKAVGTRTERLRGKTPSQRSIARQFGVSSSTVSLIYNGKAAR